MPLGDPLAYPIGSIESRAAARAMLEAQHIPAGQYENDLLAIYQFATSGVLNYSCSPSTLEIKATYQFKEGQRIALLVDPECETYNKERDEMEAPFRLFEHAALQFLIMKGRKPRKGDTLSFADYVRGSCIADMLELAHWRESWERQLENFVFPFRVDSDFTFWKRVRKSRHGESQVSDEFGYWQKHDNSDLHSCGWFLMQRTIAGNDKITHDQASRIESICFGDNRLLAPKRAGQKTV